VATDGAIAALGADGRRLRPNIVIAGVEGLAERTWPGRRIRALDSAVISSGAIAVGDPVKLLDPDKV
jgi:hypothetical protein